METFLNETQLSEMLQVSLACLRRWRLRGEGPEYKKVGPLVRYRLEAVMQWVEGLPTGGNGRRPQPVGPPSKRPAAEGSRSLQLDHNSARNVA
jgi:Helix-turn-helix domain